MDQAGFDMEATFRCAVSTLVSPKIRVFPSATVSNFILRHEKFCQGKSVVLSTKFIDGQAYDD